MLVLFDHSTPAPLRSYLEEHTVTEARDRGWDRLSNGDLLNAAEAAGFEVLVTADKNIRYQQSLTGRRIAIVELGNPRWCAVLQHVEKVVAAVRADYGGQFHRSGNTIRRVTRRRTCSWQACTRRRLTGWHGRPYHNGNLRE